MAQASLSGCRHSPSRLFIISQGRAGLASESDVRCVQNRQIKPNALTPFVCSILFPNIFHSQSHLEHISRNATGRPLVG